MSTKNTASFVPAPALFAPRRAAFGLTAALSLAASLAGGCGDEGGDAGRELGVFTSDSAGFDTHSYYLDTGREVVVFDAQFTEPLAEQLIARIRKETASPIRYVVVTHPNPDKFNGAGAFQRIGAKVVSSQATAQAIPTVHAYKKYYFTQVAKSFTDATYPPEAHVDQTFTGALDLPLEGGARVELRELKNAGVSTTQTVAYVPASRSLVVGDLVHHGVHAWLEGGIVGGQPRPDLASWQRALTELAQYPDATVYGGRGGAAPVAQAVRDQAAYLTKLEAIVTQYVADLAAQGKKAELADPALSGAHYDAIMKKAQEAFPGYGLAYMIQYGVYGLVNAIAARP